MILQLAQVSEFISWEFRLILSLSDLAFIIIMFSTKKLIPLCMQDAAINHFAFFLYNTAHDSRSLT